MKRFFLSVLLFSCCNFLFAQNVTIGVSGTPLRALKTQNEKGSPYFNDQFAKSDVVTKGGKAISLAEVRYNVLKQQIEYLNNDVVYDVQDSILSFKITDTIGKVHLLEKKQLNNKPYFFEVLAPGKIALLKHYTAKTSSSEDWYTKKKVVTIVHDTIYFVMKNDVIEKFSPSKKNILALFADRQEQIKAFMNNNATDLKSDESLKPLFAYYNTK
jgi:hypothetical protein